MRWFRVSLMITATLFASLLVIGVTAADPVITVVATRRDASGAVATVAPMPDKQGALLPVALLGEYVIVSGQGFAPNQPVQAYLAVQSQAFPLAYQDLAASVTATQPEPRTDATGGFQHLAFTLPPLGTLTNGMAEVQVNAGPMTARATVSVDSGVVVGTPRGDEIAVGIGAGFSLFAAIIILLLLRGLPVYPVGQTASRRVQRPGAA